MVCKFEQSQAVSKPTVVDNLWLVEPVPRQEFEVVGPAVISNEAVRFIDVYSGIQECTIFMLRNNLMLRVHS